jgi:hypothetical protein
MFGHLVSTHREVQPRLGHLAETISDAVPPPALIVKWLVDTPARSATRVPVVQLNHLVRGATDVGLARH